MPSEYTALGTLPQPWKLTDVIAEASLIGGIFGLGGGGQVNSALALQALEQRFGRAAGKRAWSDFREADDPEAPTHDPRTSGSRTRPGARSPRKGWRSPTRARSRSRRSARRRASSAAADRSRERRAAREHRRARCARRCRDPTHASNWELVSARHSANGHALAVMGPQVGYYVPEILMEEDLHGPGIDARGAAFPGVNQYVELGHGRDYAWSATTATSDNVVDVRRGALPGRLPLHVQGPVPADAEARRRRTPGTRTPLDRPRPGPRR